MRILTFLFIISGISANCQSSIKGVIVPSPDWEQKLYVIRIDRIGLHSPVLIDSVFLDGDGSFSYSFNPDPQGVLYELRQPPKRGDFKSLTDDNRLLVISNKKETINISTRAGSLSNSLKTEGGSQNSILQMFIGFRRPIFDLLFQLSDSTRKNPAKTEQYKEKYLSVLLTETESLKKKIIQVLDTTVSTPLLLAGLYYLNEASLGLMTDNQIRKYVDLLENDEILIVRNTRRGINSPELQRIGLVLPNTQLLNPEGKTISLQSIEAKFKVLDFWASWCGPCRYANKNQLPQLNAFLTENKIPLIAISIDKDKAKWKEAVIKDNTDWGQYIEPDYVLSRLLDVGGIPLYIVVDENNNVIFQAATASQVKFFLKEKV